MGNGNAVTIAEFETRALPRPTREIWRAKDDLANLSTAGPVSVADVGDRANPARGCARGSSSRRRAKQAAGQVISGNRP